MCGCIRLLYHQEKIQEEKRKYYLDRKKERTRGLIDRSLDRKGRVHNHHEWSTKRKFEKNVKYHVDGGANPQNRNTQNVKSYLFGQIARQASFKESYKKLLIKRS